jgi:hypothetical protein
MNTPVIEFVPVRSWRVFSAIRSNNEVIRFRVLERSKFTLIDGDWFSTRWELAPAAYEAISAHCGGRASEWGGGRACVIIHARPDSAEELKRFLIRILNDPASWLHWERECRRFVPLHVLEAAA